MKKTLILNYVSGETIKTKYFDTVEEGYKWALENLANEGDYEYYRECCGNSLDDVVGEELQVAVLKNAFERTRGVYLEVERES